MSPEEFRDHQEALMQVTISATDASCQPIIALVERFHTTEIS